MGSQAQATLYVLVLVSHATKLVSYLLINSPLFMKLLLLNKTKNELHNTATTATKQT